MRRPISDEDLHLISLRLGESAKNDLFRERPASLLVGSPLKKVSTGQTPKQADHRGPPDWFISQKHFSNFSISWLPTNSTEKRH
jgi:hypothetical protein